MKTKVNKGGRPKTENDPVIKDLKERYIAYYRICPIQKYAAMSIGRTVQTVIEWKDKDEVFFNKIQEADADFVKANLMKTKADWKLERIKREDFGQSVDITSGGEKLSINVVSFSDLSTDKKDE